MKQHRILGIGDVHEPNCRKGYRQFCYDLYKTYHCNMVIFLGDMADLHSVSFHDHHPEADGPSAEIKAAKAAINRWYRLFPDATVCIGNHDRLLIRQALAGAVPEFILKSFNEIWGTPRWKWVPSITVDGVLYVHGDGAGGGIHPAYNTMRKTAQSVVMGHNHTAAGLKFLCNKQTRLFGMDVGCGIDYHKVQFLYQDRNPCKPIISAGTIIDGMPQLHLMPCGKGEKYHESNFKD